MTIRPVFGIHGIGFGLGVSGGVVAAAPATWWDNSGAISGCVGAWQAKGAASQSASYSNLANPGTYDLTEGTTAPTWDTSTGWLFSAAGWLKTGIQPSSTWSVLCRFSDTTDYNSEHMLGCFREATGKVIAIIPASYGVTYRNCGDLAVSPSMSSGVLGFADRACFRNGSKESSSIAAGSGDTTREIFLGALNYDGTAFFKFSGRIQAVAVYNVTLSDADMGTISTAMAAL